MVGKTILMKFYVFDQNDDLHVSIKFATKISLMKKRRSRD